MTAELSGFRRFLHWGPITALSIIKCITFTTLYMNSMWWPPRQSFPAFLHQCGFLLLSTLATFNYVMATVTGPGLLPRNWQPKVSKDVVHLQYCKECEGYKAPRSHHCRKCNRCIKKMDHHCPWINHCVGWANHAYFTYFLAFAILGSLHSAIVLCCVFYRAIHRPWYLSRGLYHMANVHFTMNSIILCIVALGLAIGVVIALGMLLYFQLKTIWLNQTGIEIWIVEKAFYRRQHNPELDEFIYPYDLGWRNNFRQVFNSNCVNQGDGIEWPVREGSDQYTLTREQIAQKSEKRARTRAFRCIRPATGSYLPLFSQGFRVCFASPCTDEPRIALQPDDIIKVTRFRKHWLFGERVISDDERKDPKRQRRPGPIRGWFPRRCAIELIMPESSSESEDAAQPTEVPKHIQPIRSFKSLKNGTYRRSAKVSQAQKETIAAESHQNGIAELKKNT